MVFNNYGNGTDTLGNPSRLRLHTDDSVEVRYFNHPERTGISKMAFSFTGDLGCEYGGGVTCHGGSGGPKQAFLGWMLYNRIWFHKDMLGLTLGGGMMNNPGRYLTLLPPINGADAISGSPYFTANPGDKAHMWDATLQSTVHAQAVHHLVAGGWLSPLRRAVLVGPRRDYASWRQYRLTRAICLRRRRLGRDKRSGHGVHELRRAGQRVVPGSAQRPGHPQRGRDGEVLVETCRSIAGQRFGAAPID